MGAVVEGPLDLSRLGKKIWLVKVPNTVAAAWTPLCQQALAPSNLEEDAPSIQLGTIRVQSVQQGEPAQVTLSINGETRGPRSFQLSQLTHATGGLLMACASKTAAAATTGPSNLSSLAAVGQVDMSFNATPMLAADDQVDDVYAAMSKERNIKASTRTRAVQPYEDTRENHLTRITASKQGLLGVRRKAEEYRRVREDSKRVRSGASELEHALFALFARQSHWTMAQLQLETKQPSAHLKTVLEVIAMHHKRGPQRDTWELKKEWLAGATAEQ
mmetsp:Transcript_1001/g.1609  ORF Transcript_1001/g.1609 Transcript_1001/m.1609 type:complete len:274 (+) Transcript_1001:70-891(+)|eukprot:CAMPEP_0119106760 /NCGR_PEP_ID=MMETSP1180-20130426/6305_1 /TAXON_ID=3052 ORGANISM="Chlamydomonas cf sp, Strain CCMP681" /NCGR_SAMPLE_ID=MMETSP1180 /ASSEMBLY_ACC=CAM_ASM_000741 /LENGTH=273 /DNA_ID=CAMNT_0007092147 /DNA_START=70 /DNA_END=891 /DNA_ORIENTATION=-